MAKYRGVAWVYLREMKEKEREKKDRDRQGDIERHREGEREINLQRGREHIKYINEFG